MPFYSSSDLLALHNDHAIATGTETTRLQSNTSGSESDHQFQSTTDFV